VHAGNQHKPAKSRGPLALSSSMQSSPDPDLLAAEIIEDLKSALEQFEGITWGIGRRIIHA